MACNVEVAPFAMVPKWLVCSEVSDRAVRLFARIYLYGGEDHTATLKRRTLADELGCSLPSVDRALVELSKLGALRVEETYDQRGDRGPNRYFVWPEIPTPSSRVNRGPLITGDPTPSSRVNRQEVESSEVESTDSSIPKGMERAGEAAASSSSAALLAEARPDPARDSTSGSQPTNPKRAKRETREGGTGPATLPGMPAPAKADDAKAAARALLRKIEAARGKDCPTVGARAVNAVAKRLGKDWSPDELEPALLHVGAFTDAWIDGEITKMQAGVNGYAGKSPPGALHRIGHAGAKRGSGEWDGTGVQPGGQRAKAGARD